MGAPRPFVSSRALAALALAIVLLSSLASASSVQAAASVFLSPSGSDSNACTQVAPCRSLNRGYRVAQPGQVVELAAGTYGTQNVQFDAAKTSTTDVLFQPAAGGSVSIGFTELRGGHIEFRDLRFTDGWRTWDGISDFTFRNVTGRKLSIYGTRDVSVIGGDYGPSHNEYSFISATAPGAGDPGQILIDGVRFHDYTRDASAHTECLHVAAADGITIRGSRFERCAVMDLFFTTNTNSASPPHGVLLENNFFGPTVGGFYTVLFDRDYDSTGAAIAWRDVTVRHNSFGQVFTIEDGSNTVSNVRVSANAGEIANCRAGVTFARNVWRGRSCSASDRNVTSVGFRDPGNLDYHLAPGSPAIDAGDPASYPTLDIDGHGRPVGVAPDAGADEFGSTGPPSPSPAPPPPPGPPSPPPPGPSRPRALSRRTPSPRAAAARSPTDPAGVTPARSRGPRGQSVVVTAWRCRSTVSTTE